jgi:hypothetical protein
MASPSSLSTVPWYRGRIRAWAYLSALSFRELSTLYLAIFFLFSIFGFYDDLTNTGAKSQIWIVLVVAVLSGGYAVLYPWALIYKTRAHLITIAVFNSVTGIALPNWMRASSHHIPAGAHLSSIDFDANGILVCVIASYCCFVGFIRKQATNAFRIQNELDLAHSIQRTLVPPITTSLSGYDLHGVSIPSEKVGGDLVDVVALDNGGTVAYVADVSGHGLQAGILMGMIKTAARTILLEDFADPSQLLYALCDRLNRALPGVKEAHMYATLSALYLAPNGRVHYTLAAHPAILHYQAATRSVTQLGCEQLPVGLLPVSDFVSYSLEMQPGDILAISTDGILEACDKTEEEFGSDRVAALLDREADSANLEQTSEDIMKAVQAFGKQVDDQTLLLVRRQSGKAAERDIAA